jgi:hypothetical protein
MVPAGAAGNAIQVADCRHLINNLSKAVESAVKRQRRHLRPDPPKVQITPVDSHAADGPRAQRTRARHAEVHALVAKGWQPPQICQALSLCREPTPGGGVFLTQGSAKDSAKGRFTQGLLLDGLDRVCDETTSSVDIHWRHAAIPDDDVRQRAVDRIPVPRR